MSGVLGNENADELAGKESSVNFTEPVNACKKLQ